MKNLFNRRLFKQTLMLCILSVTNALAWAQDSTMTATTTTTSSETQTWYAEPWVWGVGGVVLILLIVALTRGGGNTDKVIITKTTTNDTV